MTIKLTPAQRKVVEHRDGALLVVAGPGSGKTRVLTERIRSLLAEPRQHFRVLALTFTNKAANEMGERLRDVPGVQERAFVGTLHSFCTEVLANRGAAVGIDGLPHVFESYQDRKQVLSDAAAQEPHLLRKLDQCSDARSRSRLLDSWLEFISGAKNQLILPEAVDDETQRCLYETYNAGLRASDAVDFDDLLLLTYRLFLERPKIADFYRRQYRYICVDEAQDLNEAQYRVICALCGNEYRNVMLVGDPKQAIFMWNGADPKFLEVFARDFGADSCELTENFRCSRAVVEAAMALDPAYRVSGAIPIRGELRTGSLEDEEAEAEGVMRQIEKLRHKGHPDIEGSVTLERCAVLGRSKFAFRALEERLRAEGWPYYKKLSAAPLASESNLVREFELALRIIANPADRLHLGMLSKSWGASYSIEQAVDLDLQAEDCGFRILDKLASGASTDSCKAVCTATRALSWSPDDFRLLAAMDSLDSHATQMPDEERATIMEDTREWRKHWDYYLRSVPGGHHSVPSFLTQIALGTTQQPRQEGVALLTVHSAKGMEFDVVFVIGMAEGTFPDYRAAGSSLEEEARNAFVAVTRSKRLLYLTYPRYKLMPWGDRKQQEPSRYLKQLSSIKL